jgi:hypothetical protein
MLDWINLPAEAETLSLWDTLHDGDLQAVESDILSRSVKLRFDVGYVREFNSLPEETRFSIHLIGVQSVRLLKWASPGEFSPPLGVSREKQQELLADYHSKWREESQPWSDLERLSGEGLEIKDATLARAANAVALRLGAVLDDDGSYVEAFIRAQAAKFLVGDRAVSPEQFVSLGEGYWEAFAKRKSRQNE